MTRDEVIERYVQLHREERQGEVKAILDDFTAGLQPGDEIGGGLVVVEKHAHQKKPWEDYSHDDRCADCGRPLFDPVHTIPEGKQ